MTGSASTALTFPLHTRLKDATRQYHDRLESGLGLLDSDLSLPRLREILCNFYGWYSPVEAAMVVSASAGLSVEVRRRQKSKWLMADLLCLGMRSTEIAALPVCSDIPLLGTDPRTWGALYVMEGATLGGQTVMRSIQGRLGHATSRAGKFFQSYGRDVPVMWTRFLQHMHETIVEAHQVEETIRSACDTFASLERWMNRPSCERGLYHHQPTSGERAP